MKENVKNNKSSFYEIQYLNPLKIWGFILLFFLFFFVINGVVENIMIEKEISTFIKRGVFEREEFDGFRTVKYYKVSRETSFEDTTLPSLSYSRDDVFVGSEGDIVLSKDSPFESIPFVNEFVGYFFGGHAAVITQTNLENEEINYPRYCLNVNGKEKDNTVRYETNDWFYDDKTIGVRVKNATLKDKKKFTDNIKSKIGKKYNYTFIFNTKNSYYCTDLISTLMSEVNKKCELNDGYITTVNDLFLSNDTYLFYYHYVTKNVKYVYYLD